MSACKRTDGGYALRMHKPDCMLNTCPGCLPCTHDQNGNPVRHCEIRRRCTAHLDWGDQCCPKCLGIIRQNLRGIVDAMAAMPGEALETGVNSEPADLAGPVANRVLAQWRLVNLDRQGVEVEELDPDDPYTALTLRERMIREDLGHDDEILCSNTLSEAAAYLDMALTLMARDEKQILTIVDLMQTTSKIRAHVEAVLHASRSPERGAPCPSCADPKPRLAKRYTDDDKTGANDYWQCPNESAHWWSEADYRLWVTEDYLANATRLTADQMLKAHGIKPGSLTGWASKLHNDGRPIVRKRGTDQRGRVLYDVADALAAHGA